MYFNDQTGVNHKLQSVIEITAACALLNHSVNELFILLGKVSWDRVEDEAASFADCCAGVFGEVSLIGFQDILLYLPYP